MNFRSRIIATFLAFATALAALFGLLLDTSMTFVEDKLVSDYLAENLDYLEDKIQQGAAEDQLITTPKLKTYLTRVSDVPAHLAVLTDGLHEAKSVHILVKTLDSGFYSGEKLILSFDESKAFLDQNESNIGLAITGFFLLIISLAGVVCIYLARSIASPIEHLARSVSSGQDEIVSSPVLTREDELGSLARAFAQSVDRIHDLLEREKNFSRYASHELRTPLTVVKNNVDILRIVTPRLAKEDLEVEGKVQNTYANSVKRLDQAVWFMEQQINTLLLLARGEYQPNFEELDFASLVDQVAAYFPDLTLKRQFQDELTLRADLTILLSIISNILNNVVEHGSDDTGKATATIAADSSGLTITNAANSAISDRNGKRFGLEIVQQLCGVMNWQLSLEESNDGTSNRFFVKVSFFLTSE